MNRFLLGCFVFFIALPAALSQPKSSQVDSLLSPYLGPTNPSFAVMVLKDGQPVLEKVYGYANIEKETKADLKTNYNLGTLSEQFVVMAAMLIQQQDKLDVKAPITDYFPDLPEYCNKVRVQHLLEHNSGLPVLSMNKFMNDFKSAEDLLNFLRGEEELMYKPGRKANWNPVNFALLAVIVNQHIESSFRKFVQNQIFEPLQMEHSAVYKEGWFTKVPNQSMGYINRQQGAFEPVELDEDSYIPGTNGIYTNLEDIPKWIHAWESDTLLTNKQLRKVQRINFIRGQKEFLGYGWKRGFNAGSKYFYSGGISSGNTHIMLRFPAAHYDIIMLSNQASLFNLRKTAFKLLNLYTEKNYEVK